MLPKVNDFRYLRVLFISKGKTKWETDRWISAASAVMQLDTPSVLRPALAIRLWISGRRWMEASFFAGLS